MSKWSTESKLKDLIEGEPRREFEFNQADIELLGQIEVHEKNTLEFFNIFGEWNRFYSIYKLGPIFIYEPHMDDKDRLWFNLNNGVMSLTVHKLINEKIEILKYHLQDGTTIISESKIR
jgi:hypothetical protein